MKQLLKVLLISFVSLMFCACTSLKLSGDNKTNSPAGHNLEVNEKLSKPSTKRKLAFHEALNSHLDPEHVEGHAVKVGSVVGGGAGGAVGVWATTPKIAKDVAIKVVKKSPQMRIINGLAIAGSILWGGITGGIAGYGTSQAFELKDHAGKPIKRVCLAHAILTEYTPDKYPEQFPKKYIKYTEEYRHLLNDRRYSDFIAKCPSMKELRHWCDDSSKINIFTNPLAHEVVSAMCQVYFYPDHNETEVN